MKNTTYYLMLWASVLLTTCGPTIKPTLSLATYPEDGDDVNWHQAFIEQSRIERNQIEKKNAIRLKQRTALLKHIDTIEKDQWDEINSRRTIIYNLSTEPPLIESMGMYLEEGYFIPYTQASRWDSSFLSFSDKRLISLSKQLENAKRDLKNL
ncbi:MAG: hypothetical protein HOI80_02015 [Alphaproteobacteria bacterium]|nr:hypothetical protein [Alphaproteobacteria bacterium]MBT5390606.1 hypothetical protein [Alphaproteobacteria bacterium]MBT5539989.1 hypothetical protein [Alphaproteobacteria bacterium]MBT5654260.1 hypothetical protein [Alphaproteobacteria bacterium]